MDEFEKQLNQIKNTGNSGIRDIEEFLASLDASSISKGDKATLRKKVDEIAFLKGIELSGPATPPSDDLNVYEESSVDNNSSSKTNKVEEKLVQDKVVSTTRTSLDSQKIEMQGTKRKQVSDFFSGSIKDWLRNYKSYYVFEMGNGEVPAKGPTLIYDKIPSPELIQRTLPGPNRTMSLDEFLMALDDSESELWQSDHVCLLVLSDFSEQAAVLLSKADSLNGFENFKFYELILDEEEPRAYVYEGERLFDELSSDINISLTNANLSKAEESLIKRFFPRGPSLIQYKLLKGGFSGSKVVEVAQVFSVPRPCKFVIKIGSKRDKRISTEETAVKKWVQSLVSNYQTEKCENATHEALKYQFASVDGKRDSISFTDFYKSRHIDAVRDVVGKLFNHEIFKQWEDLQFREEKTTTILQLYEPYLSMQKVREKVNEIGFSKAEEYNKKFVDVLERELTYTVKKVSHGDLHSENIIIDDVKVFLIDFGMTDVAHCFVDFATLEASIRLKLTPSYFPTSELNRVDQHFLTAFDVSDASIDQKVQNEDLRKSLKVISKIRQLAVEKVRGNSHTFSSNNDLELNYLLSLFCISLRNIKYSDLNQKYAMTLCAHLADKLVAKFDGQ